MKVTKATIQSSIGTSGILDRVQAATTLKEVSQLEADLTGYSYASSSTINKFNRLAQAARARIGTKPPTSKAKRTQAVA